MEEITVGEYIRTKKKGIFKVTTIRKTPYGYYCATTDNEHIPTFTIGKGGNSEIKNDIVKHSSNLIDLIEVGDMVHTKDVLNEDWYWMFDEEMVKATKETIEEGIDLVEIVTKEMMESISYKVTKM